MIASVKRLALSALAIGGGYALARQLTAQPARILMYHNFCGDTPAPIAPRRTCFASR